MKFDNETTWYFVAAKALHPHTVRTPPEGKRASKVAVLAKAKRLRKLAVNELVKIESEKAKKKARKQ